MKQAIKQALIALEEDEVPIGVVIVYENHIIGRGYNQTKRLKDPTAHAEMLAITAACNAVNSSFLNECSLYTTIEPCPMCAGAIKHARLKSLTIGAPEPKNGYSNWSPSLLHKKTKVFKSSLEPECSSLMTQYFKSKR